MQIIDIICLKKLIDFKFWFLLNNSFSYSWSWWIVFLFDNDAILLSLIYFKIWHFWNWIGDISFLFFFNYNIAVIFYAIGFFICILLFFLVLLCNRVFFNLKNRLRTSAIINIIITSLNLFKFKCVGVRSIVSIKCRVVSFNFFTSQFKLLIALSFIIN